MIDTGAIETALRAALPTEHHAVIPHLAQALLALPGPASATSGVVSHAADPALTAALRALAGQSLPLVGGDVLTVGDLTGTKGLAVGAGAFAIGDLTIQIVQQAPQTVPLIPFMVDPLPDHFVHRPHEFDAIVARLLAPSPARSPSVG